MGAPRRDPINLPSSAEDRAYLAGILDGEGTFAVGVAFAARSVNPSHYFRVSISNCDEGLMAWLADIGGTVKRVRHFANRPVLSWSVAGDNAFTFTRAVLPYLRIKRGQAELALRLEALRSQGQILPPEVVAERSEIKRQVERLNQGFLT